MLTLTLTVAVLCVAYTLIDLGRSASRWAAECGRARAVLAECRARRAR